MIPEEREDDIRTIIRLISSLKIIENRTNDVAVIKIADLAAIKFPNVQ